MSAGFQKRDLRRRRVPHYWVPVLKRTVVKSEVLNTHLSVTVTDRTISLINDHYGFDHYLLKTPACDLVSMLALKLKKQILAELVNGCPRYAHDTVKQAEIYEEYKTYLSSVSKSFQATEYCSNSSLNAIILFLNSLVRTSCN